MAGTGTRLRGTAAAVRIDPEFRKRGVAGDRLAVAGETLLRRPLRLRPPVRSFARAAAARARSPRRTRAAIDVVHPFLFHPPHYPHGKFRFLKFPKKLTSSPPNSPGSRVHGVPRLLPSLYSTSLSRNVFRKRRKRIIQCFETVRCSAGGSRIFVA